MVELWEPSCEPCKFTVPALLERRAELEDDGVRIVLLGILEKRQGKVPIDEARATLASWGVQNEPFLVDLGGALMRRYGISGPPASVVLDRQGNVRWVGVGRAAAREVVAAARAAATEPCSP